MLEERDALGSLRLRGKKSFYQYPSRPPGRSSNKVLLKRNTQRTNDKGQMTFAYYKYNLSAFVATLLHRGYDLGIKGIIRLWDINILSIKIRAKAAGYV